MNDVLERIERKLDAGLVRVDERLTKVDERLTKVDDHLAKVDDRLAKVDDRLAKVDDRLAKVDDRLAKGDERFAQIEGQLQKQGVLLEKVSSDVSAVAEGLVGNRQVMDDKFAAVLQKLDERVQPVELASRHFARQLPVVKRKRSRRKPSS